MDPEMVEHKSCPQIPDDMKVYNYIWTSKMKNNLPVINNIGQIAGKSKQCKIGRDKNIMQHTITNIAQAARVAEFIHAKR